MKRGGAAVVHDDSDSGQTDGAPPATDPAPAGPDSDPFKPSAKGKDKEPGPGAVMPKPMRDIRTSEATSLKDYLANFGAHGSVRVRINRQVPKSVRIDGRDVVTEGHLETLDEFIDEEYLRDTHGGGSYDLTITTRSDTGSFTYAGHRTVKIAGAPKIERLPSNGDGRPAAVANPPSPPSETPVIMREMLGLIRGEIEHARRPEGIPPAVQALLEQMRQDAGRRDQELIELRRELREAQTKEPPKDPIKDQLLTSMLGGESGRITSLREQFASELRQAKESHSAEISRLEARHDRTVSDMRQSHERELSMVRQTYENQIAAINNAHQTALASTKAVADLQARTQDTGTKQLERELDTVRKERDALRDRKDKPIIEQLQELNKLKEAMGVEDSGESTVGRVVEALPAITETIGGIIGHARAAAQPQAAAAQAATAQAQVQVQRVVRHPNGERFLQKGNQLVPIKKKPAMVTNDAGTKVEAPTVDQAQLALVINLLEQAFRRNESPDIVAQTGRAAIPADIIGWIRDNETEQTSGIELFLRQVAKLPGSSPLASQLGRNWIRRVGKSLVEGA